MSEHEHDEDDGDSPGLVYFTPDGQRITSEEYREAQAKGAMQRQAFHNDIRAMFFTGMSDEHLELIYQLFSSLGGMDNPTFVINFWQGIIDGAHYARKAAAPLTIEDIEPAPEPVAPPSTETIEGSGPDELTVPHTFGCHPWQMPDRSNPAIKAWECGYAAPVEGVDHEITCGLPREAKPHTDWDKQNLQSN